MPDNTLLSMQEHERSAASLRLVSVPIARRLVRPTDTPSIFLEVFFPLRSCFRITGKTWGSASVFTLRVPVRTYDTWCSWVSSDGRLSHSRQESRILRRRDVFRYRRRAWSFSFAASEGGEEGEGCLTICTLLNRRVIYLAFHSNLLDSIQSPSWSMFSAPYIYQSVVVFVSVEPQHVFPWSL